ncbi:pirin family protein [Woodsholea maritima]|uniref:pirin family protein n=1 Tax=Woodsholea maritima TaxID=240237 RepID=UPI000375B4FF|nr:pirin family protein [Woodsholea maritima]
MSDIPAPLRHIIAARSKDLGDHFMVARVLPHAKQRLVGPFIFFDEMGPVDFAPGKGIDVRPHPHIGLATVTYLFAGEMDHRDSLGIHETIYPGDVNWMTAGSGIVHSERTGDEARTHGQHIHGIQTWVALPREQETIAPAFHHHDAAELPSLDLDGVELRLILGSAYGETSPVQTYSPIFYLHGEMPEGSHLALPEGYEERAVYVVSGLLTYGEESLKTGEMGVIEPGVSHDLIAQEPTRIMLLGGAPLDGERFIEWNFVASDKALIEKAKADWAASAEAGFKDSVFTLPPDEREHIPYP